MHRDHGVELLTGTRVNDILGDTRVTGVQLADGSRVDADVVIVGHRCHSEYRVAGGQRPQPRRTALSVANRAKPRPACTPPVTWRECPTPWLGDRRSRRALDECRRAGGARRGARARRSRGRRRSFSAVPYFSSDQYDRKIQFIGRARPHDEIVIVDGSLADRRLTALYRRGDRVVACLAVNQPLALIKYQEADRAQRRLGNGSVGHRRFVAHPVAAGQDLVGDPQPASCDRDAPEVVGVAQRSCRLPLIIAP